MSIIQPMEKIKNFRMKINEDSRMGFLQEIHFDYKITDILKVKEQGKKYAMGKVIMRLPMCGHACSVTQSCPAFVDCGLPGLSVHVNSPARILEWVAVSFSRGSSQPKDRTHIPFISCNGRWALCRQHHLGSLLVQLY